MPADRCPCEVCQPRGVPCCAWCGETVPGALVGLRDADGTRHEFHPTCYAAFRAEALRGNHADRG